MNDENLKLLDEMDKKITQFDEESIVLMGRYGDLLGKFEEISSKINSGKTEYKTANIAKLTNIRFKSEKAVAECNELIKKISNSITYYENLLEEKHIGLDKDDTRFESLKQIIADTQVTLSNAEDAKVATDNLCEKIREEF